MTRLPGARLSAEVLVVLDRAIAADPDRWNSFLSAVAAMITRNGTTVDWGLYSFPTAGATCSMANVGPAIDVEPAADDALHVIAHLAAASIVAGGTPTAAAIDLAAAYMRSRTTVNPKFLMLLTDGAPTCAGRSGALTADPTRAQADALAAIADAKAAGLPTFVLAPSTTTNDDDVNALNGLAIAGGHAEQGDIKFDTDATIATWFETTDNATSCVVALSLPGPPVPDAIAVTFNGDIVPRDRSHLLGWDYTDTTARAIQLYGAWCELIHTARTFEIDIYYGCPSSD